ncbi:MAG: response regulator, partial [Lachnospiraceae bacterium]|nr:response regulator [Lachnospiraceae bacterium]
MNSFIDRYLGDSVPARERMFYLGTFMSSFFTLLFVSVAVLLRMDLLTVLVYASISVVGTVFFFLEQRINKPFLLTVIYLIYINLICFPGLLIISPKDLIEVPLYSICGLVYSLVLLSGKARIIMYIVQVTMDMGVAYYRFVVMNGPGIHMGPATPLDYLRIEAAVIITGILCGCIIRFRHFTLKKEMSIREEATKKAEMVSDAKDMFLVNISHEIRTPLNAIIGTTDLLLDSEASNNIKEKAFNISNSSHALLSITTDLLDFSHLNIDTITPVNEKYDFAFMLNDIINLMSVRLLDSNVEFFVDIDPAIQKILIGDSGKIRQIIINMLSNAIKYTKEGYMSLSIAADRITDNEIKLHITVADSGIGIRQENIEKIFEPYNRSGEMTDRLIEGNGLGLALCKKLAGAMGGNIWAESEYGKGSTFYFEVTQLYDSIDAGEYCGNIKNNDTKVCFYITESKEAEILKQVLSGLKIDTKKAESKDEFLKACEDGIYDFYFLLADSYDRLKENLSKADVDWHKFVVISDCNYSYSGEPIEYVLTKPVNCLNVTDLLNQTKNFTIRKQLFEGGFDIEKATVLVVDDSIVNLEVAKGILERYKTTVLTAYSGAECLIALKDEHVDCIFLDYMMPEMDGIDTLKAIRALEDSEKANIPVVVLTANVVSGAREMFMEEGFNDY